MICMTRLVGFAGVSSAGAVAEAAGAGEGEGAGAVPVVGALLEDPAAEDMARRIPRPKAMERERDMKRFENSTLENNSWLLGLSSGGLRFGPTSGDAAISARPTMTIPS
jgi:hypothetical protein